MLPNIASEDWGFQIVGSENGLKLVENDSPAQGVSRLAIHTKANLFSAAAHNKVLLGKLSKLREALSQESESLIKESITKSIECDSSPVKLDFSADGSHLVIMNDAGGLAYIEAHGDATTTQVIAENVTDYSCCSNQPLLAFVSSSDVFILGDGVRTKICDGKLVSFSPGGAVAVVKEDNSVEIHEKLSQEYKLSKTLPFPTQNPIVKISFGDESSLLAGVLADSSNGQDEPKIYISNNFEPWNDYDEACPTFGNDESAPEWYFVNTGAWNLEKDIERPLNMVLFSQSSDTALVAKSGLFDLLDDSARATLPCNEDDEFPLGSAVDFGSKENVVNPFPGVENIGPMPLVYCLTNSGRVVCWSVVCKYGVPDSSKNELNYSCATKMVFDEIPSQAAEKPKEEIETDTAEQQQGFELNNLSLGGSGISNKTTETETETKETSLATGGRSAFGSAFSADSNSQTKPVFGTKSAFGTVNSTFGSSWSKDTPTGNVTAVASSEAGKTPFSFGPTQSPFASGPAFNSGSAFGSGNTSAFGSGTKSAFGSGTTSAFGSGTTSAFGSGTTSAFAPSKSSAFGSSTTPAFGSGATSAFESSAASAFGSSTTSAFGSGTTSAFGKSTGAFNTGSAFGSQATKNAADASDSIKQTPGENSGKPETSSSGFSQFASQTPGASAFGKFSESTSSPFASAASKSTGSVFGSSSTPFAPSESAQKSAFGTGRPIDGKSTDSAKTQALSVDDDKNKQESQTPESEGEDGLDEEPSVLSSSAKNITLDISSDLDQLSEEHQQSPSEDDFSEELSEDDKSAEEIEDHSAKSQDGAFEESEDELEESEHELADESLVSSGDAVAEQPQFIEAEQSAQSVAQKMATLELEAQRLAREAEEQSLKSKRDQEALAHESEQLKKLKQELEAQKQELEEQRLALEKLSVEKKEVRLTEEMRELGVSSFNCDDMGEDDRSLDQFLPINHGSVPEDLGDLDSLWADVSRIMRILDHNQRFLAVRTSRACSDSSALSQIKSEATSLRTTLDGLKEQAEMLSLAKGSSEAMAVLMRQADSLAQALNAVFREHMDERFRQRPLSLTETRLRDEILKVKDSAESTAREIENTLFSLSLRTRSKDTLPSPADLAVAADAVDIVMRRALAVVSRFTRSREAESAMNLSIIQPRGLGPEDFSLDETHFSQRRYSRKATRALAAVASQRAIADLQS